MDRETVITHLQIIHTWAEFARERDLQFFTAKHLEDITKWSDDAMKLLKEQEDLGTELTNAVELIHKKNERIEKLLKEQEPKNILDIADSIEGIEVGKCPRCDRTILNKQSDPTQFCKYCGQAVKWE